MLAGGSSSSLVLPPLQVAHAGNLKTPGGGCTGWAEPCHWLTIRVMPLADLDRISSLLS